MILPEFITSVPVVIEDAIQDLCEITITTKRLRKRPPTNSTPKTSKQLKTKTDDTITYKTIINEPTSSKNLLTISHSPKQAKNDQTPSKKTPWRPLKLKKKKHIVYKDI